jgi:hypothetical protein
VANIEYESVPIKYRGGKIFVTALGHDIEDNSRLAWGKIQVEFGKSKDEGIGLGIMLGGRQSGEFVGVTNMSLYRSEKKPGAVAPHFKSFTLDDKNPTMVEPWIRSIPELSNKFLNPTVQKMLATYGSMNKEAKWKSLAKFDGRYRHSDPEADGMIDDDITLPQIKKILLEGKDVNLEDANDLRTIGAKLPSVGDDWSISPFQRGIARLAVMIHASTAINGIDILKEPMLAMMKDMSSNGSSEGAYILSPYLQSMNKSSEEYKDLIKSHWSNSCQ